MGAPHRNNPDIESPGEDFPGRPQSGSGAPGMEHPVGESRDGVGRDEEQ